MSFENDFIEADAALRALSKHKHDAKSESVFEGLYEAFKKHAQSYWNAVTTKACDACSSQGRVEAKLSKPWAKRYKNCPKCKGDGRVKRKLPEEAKEIVVEVTPKEDAVTEVLERAGRNLDALRGVPADANATASDE